MLTGIYHYGEFDGMWRYRCRYMMVYFGWEAQRASEYRGIVRSNDVVGLCSRRDPFPNDLCCVDRDVTFMLMSNACVILRLVTET